MDELSLVLIIAPIDNRTAYFYRVDNSAHKNKIDYYYFECLASHSLIIIEHNPILYEDSQEMVGTFHGP